MSRRTDKQLAPKTPYFHAGNPKDLVAQNRLDTSLIPDVFLIELAMAFYEGALKYGRYNWRMAPVKASVYFSAFDRHWKKWNAGEERDKKTGTHHFGYMGCCVGILCDAQVRGSLVDDRPPIGRNDPNISAWLDGEIKTRIEKLQELFKAEKPYQYTIGDTFDDGGGGGGGDGDRISQRRSKVRRKKGSGLVLMDKAK